MTFRAERYPAEWPSIRAAIRARAGERCECTGECGDAHEGGRCNVPNGATIKRCGAAWREHNGCTLCAAGDPSCKVTLVVLTVAHLDHDEANNDHTNLAALCQRCHLRHDAADNARRRRENKAAAREAEVAALGQGSLFGRRG